jgi:mercuric ion transport protein
MNASSPQVGTGGDLSHARTRRFSLAGAAALSGLASAGVATLAGLCCAGPLTVLLLGTSGAVAAAALAPYRLPLLLLSAALIAGAYWRLRRAGATNGAACSVPVARWARRSLIIASAAWIVGATLWLAAR